MTTSGWILLTLSVGIVTIGFLFCIIKVLTSPPRTDAERD